MHATRGKLPPVSQEIVVESLVLGLLKSKFVDGVRFANLGAIQNL
jgi:hypothetical protein